MQEKQNKTRKKLVLPRKEAKSASFFALLLSLMEQQQVFCSDMTFDATVNPVAYEGGELVFIDTEYDTWNMDPEALKKAFEIYPDVCLIVVAHYDNSISEIKNRSI